MRVAIVGSWRSPLKDDWELRDESGFSAACKMLGGAIVNQGHTLLVASDSEQTADFHAVEGALEALNDRTLSAPPIVVYGERRSFAPWLNRYPHWSCMNMLLIPVRILKNSCRSRRSTA